ncbi:MAG: aspartate/glutamate racemase family protein [Magnetococcales bacterium]|nr:aspartate/glutamate racemase family protein [Magnetococcales bacterium]
METDVSTLPPRVRQTLDFFRSHGVWHILSRNTPATSCQDAAHRRQRLGKTGIPLHDEVKSLFMKGQFGPLGARHVLLHCRATARFDLEAAAVALDAETALVRVQGEELARLGQGIRYGTVNPFSEAAECIQVFDSGLLTRLTPPHTVMTNAGDLTWGVEFRPAEAIAALEKISPKVVVSRITTLDSEEHTPPVFGILTGNGPESGMALWRHINDHIYASMSEESRLHGDLSYPRVHIQSIPEMGLSMELLERKEEVWLVMQDAIRRFIQDGVTHIALACNTTQYFANQIKDLCKPSGIQFTSMADVVVQHVRDHHLDDLTILGIPIVANMGQYSAYAPLKELGVQSVLETALPHLQEIGYMVKKLGRQGGKDDSKTLNKLVLILRIGVKTRNVLIALTEISVLLERFPRHAKQGISGINIIDCLELYGKFFAKVHLDAMPREIGDRFDEWE